MADLQTVATTFEWNFPDHVLACHNASDSLKNASDEKQKCIFSLDGASDIYDLIFHCESPG